MQGLGIVVKTTDEQEKRLERLLPWHQKHVEEDGSYPHSNWITSDMLECLVNIHAKELVEFLLWEEAPPGNYSGKGKGPGIKA